MILFLVGLILGAIAVLAAEAAALLYVINRLNKKTKATASSLAAESTEVLDPQQSLDFAYNKKGFVWVLEPEKVPKEKVSKEQKRKKDFLEVYPVRKYAKIKDCVLILIESDGSQTAIPLKGCVIEAVSASSLPSRKWAKRFPIKVENKTSVLYHGSNIIYIYLETSWEKESWCKSLRLASCNDKKKLHWFTNLNEEFHSYLASLTAGYPSFMKPPTMLAESPSMGLLAEPIDRANKFDFSSSKVQLLWKKLARKASKPCIESKALGSSYSGREERKIYEKFCPSQDSVLGSSVVKSGTTKIPNNSREENAEATSSTFPRSKSQSQISVVSDAESDDKFIIDEATLCWNLLIFRLFFDYKNNAGMQNSIKARIQRTMSNMRTPSYIGEIICTDIDIGNLPPYIHRMRVLPADINEVWAFEVDIEYSGGVVLDIETRLEVHELDVQKGIVDANSESTSVGDVPSDLLEDFEYLGKQLNIPEGTVDGQAQKDEGDPKLADLKNHKSTVPAATSVSRWKSILNSIAKQVSQVPISLSIRVASLRGTVRLHLKPPPSDQLWFGFTSMPDIEFNLESSVGDHKITSGNIAFFLINKFKAAIRETMVLPNCESVCIPWMLAEKEDWVPRNVAPYIWLSQEASSEHTTASEAFSSQTTEAKRPHVTRATSIDHPEHKQQNLNNKDCNQRPNIVSKAVSISSASTSIPSIQNSKYLQELKTPLLPIDEPGETCQQDREEMSERGSPPSMSSTESGKQIVAIEEDDSRPKKMGRRAKMLDLGKKMGERFEEKRRHIEEKSRHIVEKMRGP
ncbi:testis-expressed sequence 2 protein-like [Melia azedarach]|uniref:Testis-expressed sequence 2 protein-like n=1 Tax=Melia azedarach TaxID=155640 RepID=A0ACC1XR62_MELAZ|nr:testis-expressed sequence 2 protein-like [Melia azedarach]